MHEFELPPLSLEHLARIWWASAHDTDPASWEMVAAWCYGAHSVAATAEDRATWHLLGLIAWDRAGYKRTALSEVAA